VGFCEHGNEFSCSIKTELLDYLRVVQLPRWTPCHEVGLVNYIM
jgi:hypothetical protein